MLLRLEYTFGIIMVIKSFYELETKKMISLFFLNTKFK